MTLNSKDIQSIFPPPEGKQEEWAKIVNYPDYYISNIGRVASFRNPVPHLVKIQSGDRGRLHVTLGSSNKEQTKFHSKRVSRLVAEAFVPNPEGYNNIEFIDGDYKNCSASNLKWVSLTKRMKTTSGERQKPIRQYDINGKYITTYNTLYEAFEKTGVHNISSVCSGRMRKAGGFIWRFACDFPAKDLSPEDLNMNHGRNASHKISQFTLDGKLVATYNTVTDASEAVGDKTARGNIIAVCKGKRKSACGFLWKYED